MAAARLSGLDTAFLCLGRDVSPMHLGALAIFRPIRPGDPERVAALLTDRAQLLPELRQRVQPAWFPLEATSIAASVLRRVRLPAPGSPLVISSSGQRALATVRLDLRPVRRIRERYGGTVNDFLLSVVAGALRERLVARGDSVEGLSRRAFIPVSRRARSGDRTGGKSAVRLPLRAAGRRTRSRSAAAHHPRSDDAEQGCREQPRRWCDTTAR